MADLDDMMQKQVLYALPQMEQVGIQYEPFKRTTWLRHP